MLIKARATKEIFHRDDFYIIAFTPFTPYPSELQLSEYMNFTCKGALSWVTIGQDYEMDIDFVESNRYGVTYKINSVPSMQKQSFEDLSRAESFEILRQCTTSDTIANNILDVYPTFIHKILTEGKESIDVKKIKGVGDAYLACYERELTSKYKYFKILMDYSEFDLNVDDCKKLYSLYENDDNISKQFTEYPYNVLCVDLERSFGSVDKILKEKRKDLNKSVQRCTACIMDILNRNEYDGNTRILGNDMFVVMRDEYNVPELLDMVVDTCKESNYIFYDEKNKYIAKASTYGAECRVAQFVQDKLNSSPMNKWDYIDTSKYKNVDGFEMSDEQLSLLDNVCNNDIVLLCGFGGSGKTSSVKAFIKMLDDYNKSYTLLSFSGKASRVLSEATNRTATTIHLKCLRDGEIDSDVILIDEFTMTSLDTFCMLLSCVTNENAKFVFVGDTAQLPAISLGKLFKDMLDSGKIPTTMLTKIFRYSSNGMLYSATNTRQGRPFLYDDVVKQKDNVYSIGNNFEFISLDTDEIKNEVSKQYQKLLNKGIKKQDIVVCTPMNKGDIGTIELNNTLQAEFNPPKPNELILTRKYGQKNIVFRVGDIVLNCKNDYKAVSYDAWQMIGKDDDDPWNDSSYGGNLTEEDVADKIVMNGQLGVVRDIIENEGMLVQFDEDLIFVNKGKINHMLLGYALTTHKLQGSTVNYTINIVSEQHSRMLNRNLEYVAITRSREKTICIGNIGAFDDCLRIEANDYRDTYLKDLLLSIDNVA